MLVPAAALTVLVRDFPPDQPYLIGVSGGRDSVALLHFLVTAGYKRLHVCHLNHRLRGRASAADARFVCQLATRYHLPARADSVDVRALAKKKKLSLETAGREARYEFFARVAARRRCRTIFLGHHADDLVETFLINLFRGAGPAGLASLRDESTRKVGAGQLRILRPLLSVWRPEIDLYIKRERLAFREDASNRDIAPLRNRMRRRIVPYLEKSIGRNIRQNIWRTARIAAEEENFLETLLSERLPDSASLAVGPLREMSLALQRRVLHKWLRAGDVTGVSFDLVERVRGLLDSAGRVAKTNLPGNRYARRRAKKIFIEG
ncbi:MAG TPA: tRNA lysidine(34) synthetase TilS [Chthoniobacterales bacterium]